VESDHEDPAIRARANELLAELEASKREGNKKFRLFLGFVLLLLSAAYMANLWLQPSPYVGKWYESEFGKLLELKADLIIYSSGEAQYGGLACTWKEVDSVAVVTCSLNGNQFSHELTLIQKKSDEGFLDAKRMYRSD